MSKLTVDISNIYDFVSNKLVFAYKDELIHNQELLETKTGKGSEFLGWLNLPSSTTADELATIDRVAFDLRSKSDIVVIVGIGGSYLGSKAAIEALGNSFANILTQKEDPIVLFAGQNICEDYHKELLELLDGRSYSIVVISKSGTTTEPAVAFRLLKQHLENKVGKAEAAQRIVAITDKSKGALRKLADQEGYRTFIISDDIGGRYSVLTPVGLLPGGSIRREPCIYLRCCAQCSLS